MSKWVPTRTDSTLGSGVNLIFRPGRKRQHHDRLHLGIVIGALVVLAAWGLSELVR